MNQYLPFNNRRCAALRQPDLINVQINLANIFNSGDQRSGLSCKNCNSTCSMSQDLPVGHWLVLGLARPTAIIVMFY